MGELKDELRKVLRATGGKLATRQAPRAQDRQADDKPQAKLNAPGPAPLARPKQERSVAPSPRVHKTTEKRKILRPLQPVLAISSTSAVGRKLGPSKETKTASKPQLEPKPEASIRFTPASPAKLCIRYAEGVISGGTDWEIVGTNLALDPDRKRPKTSCVVGLDFGTAYTKACVRFRGSSVFVVSWKDAVRCESEFLLPSSLTVLADGTCVLGSSGGGKTYDSLKTRLLETNSGDAMVPVVAFLALATRYVRGWLYRNHRGVFRGFPLDWFVNIGLPSVPWESDGIREIYESLCQAAWNLGAAEGRITVQRAEDAVESALKTTSTGHIAAIPEFVAQIAGYVRSPQRSGDLHMLVDIGAGTVDVVTFNVGYLNDEDLFPIFEAEVVRLGTHYLLATRAATIQKIDQAWRESDAGLSTKRFADLYGDPDRKLGSVSEQFGQELTRCLVAALRKTKARRYPLSPAWKTSVPVFMCGGGKSIDVYQQAFALAGNGFGLRKLRLPVADNVQSSNLDENNFDRVSVAHGLSFFADDLGKICRRSEVEDIPAYWNNRMGIEDRFVGKDQV